ncbi:MAG TPA: energy transducer TonB [Longimicrobium sp.]|jgi:TonB family protein
MRRTATRSALLLAAAAALASAAPLAAQQDSTAHAPAAPARRTHDYFAPCPGQEAAMAAVAARPQVRRRPHALPEILRVRIRQVSMPVGSPAPTAANPGTRIAFSEDLVLQLQVDAEGKVQSVQVVRSTGDADFDAAFVADARGQRFDPAAESAFPVPGCAIETLHVRG